MAHGAIDRACFGVAGPVIDNTAALTNVPWTVEASGARRSVRLSSASIC